MAPRSHIDLVFRDTTQQSPITEDFVVRVLQKALTVVRAPQRKYEVGLTVVGSAAMRSLNKKFRKVDAATDVLSFPLNVQYGPRRTIMALGDIVICLPVARKKANAQHIAITHELGWLIAHGFLHLYGYDHERSAREARLMERHERAILAEIDKD